jgi:hypothetical protein
MFNVFVERLVIITTIRKPSSYLVQCFWHSMTLFSLYWAFKIELSEARFPTRYLLYLTCLFNSNQSLKLVIRSDVGLTRFFESYVVQSIKLVKSA